MGLAYLEWEDLFTSNGFFKIWNKFSRKKFPIFSEKFVPTLCRISFKRATNGILEEDKLGDNDWFRHF